jgi:hypothetical protein
MAAPSSFLQQSGQALAAAKKCLRFALLQDLQRDRQELQRKQKTVGSQFRHLVRYYGGLLAVSDGYDSSDPRSIKDSVSAHTTLGRIGLWARAGFHPDVFDYLIPSLDSLQGRVDAITRSLASYNGKQNSPSDTLETFLGLAYHSGVAAVAATSSLEQDEFTAAALERLVSRSLVRSPVFDVVQIGAPKAVAILVRAIVEVLDYMYIAMHGDMAFLLGCWVNAVEMDRFSTERGEIEVFHPVEEPAFTVTPPFPGLAATFPTPPQFPGGNLGQEPTLTLQSTVYRRWEELARGPQAKNAVDQARADIQIAKWLEQKPVAKPPKWPLPAFDRRPRDDAERKRWNVGLNTNRSVQDRLDWLKTLLAGSDKGKKEDLHSYMTYLDGGRIAERMVILNGGAYPRGGRKPPSVTHDTTYGLDLDIVNADVQQGTQAAARNALGVVEEAGGFEDPDLRHSYATTFFTPGRSLYDTEGFVPAVAFTQAILTTLPSRMIFGDPLVLIGAFGGLLDHLKATGTAVADLPALFAAPEDFLWFDPKGHYNHWHVDWVPQTVLDNRNQITDGWVFAPDPLRAWDLKGEKPAFKTKKRDFWRPVPVRYENPRVCGTLDEIIGVNDLLGTGIDLTDETSAPTVSPFPIGNVNDLPTLKGWLDQYFPHWRPPT